MIYIIIAIILSVVIYRIGVIDGQRLSKGEKIKFVPKKAKVDTEKEKLQNGIKNILGYGLEVNR